MTPDDLTPAEREAAQDKLLAIWLARRCPAGTRRRTDHQPVVKVAPLIPTKHGPRKSVAREGYRWVSKTPVAHCASGCGRVVSKQGNRCPSCFATGRERRP